MKILFVVNEIPYPPDNGVRIVSHHAMRLMHEKGHVLALAVLTEELDDIESRFSKIKSLCKPGFSWYMKLPLRSKFKLMISSLFFSGLYPVERYRYIPFQKKLEALIKEFKPDVVHLDIITMAQYEKLIPTGIGTVASINDSYTLTLRNLLSTKQFSGLNLIYRWAQFYQAKRYEANFYPRLNTVHVMTDIDASYLKDLNADINPCVISNGVNSSLFDLYPRSEDMNGIIFVAKLEGENLASLIKFLQISWPIVINKYPEAKLYVVGSISNDASLVIRDYQSINGVTFTGYVDKLETIYAKCGIAIVPINKNCGIVNKAIEGMVAGLAVVGFENTFAGIKSAINYQHFVAVTNYRDMGLAVAELLLDTQRCKTIKQQANNFASKQYSWNSRSDAYELMYMSAAEHARESKRQDL